MDDTQIKSEEDLGYLKLEDDAIIKKEEPEEEESYQINIANSRFSPHRRLRQSQSKPLAGVKNVVKNYGKAMCSFAYSNMALPYLNPIITEEKITLKGFVEWIQNNKEHVDSIESLRALLLPTDQDNDPIKSYKRVFQKISEIFLKYFCINWIYSGKLTHKQTHLSFRYKMLRRVRNPEMFTYLQHPPKKMLVNM